MAGDKILNNDNLKNCPHCHVRPCTILNMDKEVTVIKCLECGTYVEKQDFYDAINTWNKYVEHISREAIIKKEENGMKDILELVDKIEELLKKSKFEWFIAYDPKEKAWTFQVKEK